MAGSGLIQGDGVIARLNYLAAVSSTAPALQLVHFIQHRKRPSSVGIAGAWTVAGPFQASCQQN